MKQYVFDSSSHFFREIIAFSLPFIGLLALVRFTDLKAQVKSLVTRHNVLLRGVALPSEVIANIVIPDNNAILGNIVSSTLVNSQRFAVEAQEGKHISAICYVDVDLVSPEPGKRVLKPIPPAALPPIAIITIGSAYERVKDNIEAKWGVDSHLWPPLLQYFRHCRNAAFHGNVFNIRPTKKGRPAIDTSSPPVWRSSIMPDEASMNKKRLIGEWLDLGDVPILLGDVDELLRVSGVNP
jgi:hypothetical protein